MHSDDGRNPEMLSGPTSSCAGQPDLQDAAIDLPGAEGYRVANVPLVLDLPPPAELKVPPERVFALTIQPDALLQIRRERLARMRMTPDTSYGQRDYILRGSTPPAIFRQPPEWPVIDITGKAIEETAADILRLPPAGGTLAAWRLDDRLALDDCVQASAERRCADRRSHSQRRPVGVGLFRRLAGKCRGGPALAETGSRNGAIYFQWKRSCA